MYDNIITRYIDIKSLCFYFWFSGMMTRRCWNMLTTICRPKGCKQAYLNLSSQGYEEAYLNLSSQGYEEAYLNLSSQGYEEAYLNLSSQGYEEAYLNLSSWGQP